MALWKNNNTLKNNLVNPRGAEGSDNSSEENKVVSYGEYNKKLIDLIRKYGSNKGITIENATDEFKDEPIQVSVSGRILNATSLEEVERFILALRKAARDCENFEYNGYRIDWD